MKKRNSIESFSIEVFERIALYAGFLEALALSTSSRNLRKKMKEVYPAKLTQLLRHFVRNTTEFRNILRSTRSIISGSVALAFIDNSLADWSSPNCAGDLDIFCLREGFLPMVIYLMTNEGYLPDTDHKKVIDDPNRDAYTPNPFIDTICYLKKETELGIRRVDIIACCSFVSAAYRPIVHFHSTVVMNWLSADSLVVLYPSLTFRRRGIIHRSCSGPPPSNGPDRAHAALKKYKNRGYTLQADAEMFYLGPHRCTEVPYCAHTMRSSSDSNTFELYISSRRDIARQDPPHKALTHSTHELFWRLGSDFCYAEKYCRKHVGVVCGCEITPGVLRATKCVVWEEGL